MTKKLLFALVFTLLKLILAAQLPPEPYFHHLDANKLGVKSASNQFWDKSGKMWGVYEEGIFSYNGFNTLKWSVNKKDSTSLLSTQIQVTFLDKEDNLWIAYQDTVGITRFNTKTYKITHFLANRKNPNSVPATPITAFKEDANGNFWILSWGSGFSLFNRNTGVCKTFKPHAIIEEKTADYANRVKDLQLLKDGRYLVVCFGNESASYPSKYFDLQKQTFENFRIDEFLSETPDDVAAQIKKAIKICHFLHVDDDGNFWFGTYSGLLFFNLKTKQVLRVSGQKDLTKMNLDNARVYELDENGILWVGTPNSGIMQVNRATKEVRYLKHDTRFAGSIADNRIKYIRKDKEGNIWIANGAGGFSIYNPIVQQFKIIEWKDLGLEFSNRSEQRIPVNQMLVKQDGLIFLSSENGIYVYNTDSDKVIEHINPEGKLKQVLKQEDFKTRVTEMSFISKDKLLITAPSYPAIYNTKTKTFTRIDTTGIEARQRKLPHGILFKHQTIANKPLAVMRRWSDIIYFIDTLTKKFIEGPALPLNKDFGGNSFILKSGKWFLPFGQKEFIIFDPKTKVSNVYGFHHKNHFFPDSTILATYLDVEDNVWLGTSKGLYKFNPANGKVILMNDEIGLKAETVNAIICDASGVWWIALAEQLIRWDPKTKSTLKIVKELGLSSGSFISSVAQTDNKQRIYIASINGALVFNPTKIKVNATIPKLHLGGLIIKDDTLDIERINGFSGENNSLKWNENFLNFEFGTSQIYAPVPHRFYYRLIGLDTTWQDNGISNRIRFTNLSSGSYSLEVKTLNSYNIQSEILIVPFTIRPPFWLTWWFYVIVGLAVFFGGKYYLRYREQVFIKKQEILEAKIADRTAEVVAKAKEIELQKDIIVEKNKELTDSIYYAQRIQQSILPDDKQITKNLPQNFVFFAPKDIVSGDFYWFSKQQDSVLWAVVDCTGHGVPGGFMSMLGSGLLNQIVNEELKLRPDEILNNLRDRVIIALKQSGEIGENKDGMDLTLCRYIPSANKIQMAGAHNSLYIIRNKELIELKADKQPIGIYLTEKKPFSLNEVTVEKGDVIYMTSDGYTDQFGGPKGKKFKTSSFEKLIVEIADLPVEKQFSVISDTFKSWKGEYDQLDDVCVMCVKI